MKPPAPAAFPRPSGRDRNPTATESARPLSPHLQIYRLALNTVLSGLHRLSGLALSAASLLLVGWLAAAAGGADAYATAARLFSSWPLRLLLAGLLAVFWFHLFSGLRHLVLDAGYGFSRRATRATGLLVIAGAALGFVATLVLTPAGRWLAGMP